MSTARNQARFSIGRDKTKRGKNSMRQPVSPWVAIVALAAVGCAAVLAAARPNGAQGRTEPVIAAHPTAARAAFTSTTASGTAVGAPPAARRSLDFYTGGMRAGMFSSPQPPLPKSAALPVPPAPKVTRPKPVVVPVAPVNPFADWAYTGTVRVGDNRVALLENSKTKEGEYVRPGDTFMGANVASVTDQMVVITSAGKTAQLAKSDNVTVTPLDKSATALAPPAGTPPPGAPGPVVTGAPGQPAAGPAPGQIVLPNGMVIPADRAQRWQQRMNRRFNQ